MYKLLLNILVIKAETLKSVV
uniref:Uncharacterized protein n=1 Tax=Arundo donax TaxID=35708 RepID=A0A0A8Z8X7_ARUDO